jgi:predicted ATP-grasp superfamily ATP-dependent carboligase
LKVLLYEYVSGGGFAGEPIPSNLLSEGFAMLRGLTADFKAADHNVTVLLDSRLAQLKQHLNADNILQVNSKITQIIQEASTALDGAFVVAPESDQILKSIVEQTKKLGIISLNCQPSAITQASDKAQLPKRIKALGLNSPETFQFKVSNIDQILQFIETNLTFPIILKPVNGAGCSGVTLAQNSQEVAALITNIYTANPNASIIIQQFIEGISCSVSLLSAGSNVLPISLNLQNVTLAPFGAESSYNGGIVPYDTPTKTNAYAVAKKVIESFEGLQGYVGVDLIISENKIFVIEVNPRLTTSYVGLRKVTNFNIAQAISDAVINKKLPKNLQCNGYSYFSKIPLTLYSNIESNKFSTVPEVISPPLQIYNNQPAYGFVASYGKTIAKAKSKLDETKNRLKIICDGGQ